MQLLIILGFQELAAALMPVRTGVEAHISVNAAVTVLVTGLRKTNDGGMSIPGLSGSIKRLCARQLSPFCIICPMDGVLTSVCSCNCCCCMISSDLWAPRYRKFKESRDQYCIIDMNINWYRLSAVSLLRYLISVVPKISTSV